MKLGKTSICTMQGDITKISSVDAIVNAANSSLLGGSGVDGAIHAAAGSGLLEECRTLNGCPAGEAKITGAYKIPVKYIIHTVGPRWYGGNRCEKEILSSCYKNSLQLAASRRIRTIAFPSISTGVYNFPLEQAADIAVHAISEYIKDYPNAFDEIIFVLRPNTKEAYDAALEQLNNEINKGHIDFPVDDGPVMIGFYHEYDEYGCFSNWYQAGFDYAGRHYSNSEQFMMYQKVMMFGKYELAEKIMKTSDPGKCKKLAGQKFPEFDADLWEKTCYTIVKRGVKAKFAQNEDILEILLGTRNTILAECSPYDKKWGIGINLNNRDSRVIAKWKGKNLLGRILMEVREELRQEILLSQDGRLPYLEAHDMEPIREWCLTAGELKRIPQFFSAIHAYSDTIQDMNVRDIFYNKSSLFECETRIRENIDEILPVAGFYEMKQEVYDIARALANNAVYCDSRITFCEKSNTISRMRKDDSELQQTCHGCTETSKDIARNNAVAEYLLRDDITDDIVIIKVGRSYYPGISAQKLYDITRGCWKRRIESVERAKYALTVFKSTVIEVYKIFGWYRAEDEIRETLPYNPELDAGRIIFRGEVANPEVREKYIGKNVSKLYQRGEAGPIKTFYR